MSSQVERAYRRIRMMLAPVKITATNDSGAVHKVQVRVTPVEKIDDMPVVQIYGLASHAPTGSDGMAVFIHGDRSNGLVIATGNQAARPRNQAMGEVSLFDDQGTIITLKRGNVIEIHATSKVRIVTPRLEVTGDIIDHCDEQPHTMADDRNIYNQHQHGDVQNGQGVTGPPTIQQRTLPPP